VYVHVHAKRACAQQSVHKGLRKGESIFYSPIVTVMYGCISMDVYVWMYMCTGRKHIYSPIVMYGCISIDVYV
jgi:hypothetical protein